ncbi:probable inactive ATP-dependent zinc metalloprotease FTSHI 2, chloroplastic [Olea europaea subsp. europaea]|uniref:Probable inactive ATP-dependent zinc metalloprotease FTSHI 2, chloroplastic n=1 Tax=Olea europaea subsp. europaea TaxID=158383 RepID=A0A8S0QFP0_OLEEU|nr:probable inactive ATP-dependent zinc metalloprotease FTSHI 2, chloroplastic [Olea europaea subsp. europaea]
MEFVLLLYSPPLKKPEIPKALFWDLIENSNINVFIGQAKALVKGGIGVEEGKQEFKRTKNEELEKFREEREMMEKSKKKMQKNEEEKMRLEMKKIKYEELLCQEHRSSQDMARMWQRLSSDSNVAEALCLKKDYEDRLKIEKAEAEEKKMREPEREMAGIEDDDDEEEGEGKAHNKILPQDLERVVDVKFSDIAGLGKIGLELEEIVKFFTHGKMYRRRGVKMAGGKVGDNPYMKMAQQFMKSGARVRRAHNKRLPQYLERGVDVKFSDVAGLGKIRLELEEIVKFFTHGEMYRRRGVKIPGGILLCGPPGVGKTLLAKAVAGEAGVNFFSISASQFVEIYVGVGASRVRALYQEAKENAPSVVFIDELDAVGRERGLIKGSGGQERDATLNQLLVCLDGFEGRGEVITIASTNRPDILDPALVRPGRFDRKIYIPKPGLIGRIEILKVHARKKPMAPDVDYMAVATMTDGMVGAELANIIEVAAINMMRDGRTEITTDDLLQAAQIEERGMLDKKERSPETWKQVAINEAAMAVVAVNFPDLRNIEFVTIAPRAGRELGYVRMKMDHVKFKEGMLSRQSLLDHITVQLAPRAADELWYGEGQLSTIWAETADNARSAARTLVLGGLSERHYGLNNFWTADRINDIDTEALRILNMCYDRAKMILQQNRELMDAVVDNLVQKKSLTKREFFNLVDLHGSLQPMPPSILDIRSTKRSQLENMIADKKVVVLEETK